MPATASRSGRARRHPLKAISTFSRSGPAISAIGKVEIAFNGCRRARPEREAVAGILDGSSGHLLKAHRAPFFEHGQRGVNCSRDHGGIETFTIEVLMARVIPIDGRAFGRPTLPDNGRYFTFAAWINKHEAFAAQAVEILLNDTADEHRRNTCIERVATLQQNLKGRRRCKRMARGCSAIPSAHRRTLGGAL